MKQERYTCDACGAVIEEAPWELVRHYAFGLTAESNMMNSMRGPYHYCNPACLMDHAKVGFRFIIKPIRREEGGK